MRDVSSWVKPVLSYDEFVLLKDHNAVTPVRLEPTALRSRVKHSTTEPLRSLVCVCKGRICACMILYAPFSFIDMQHDYFKKKKKSLTFDYTPGVAGV